MRQQLTAFGFSKFSGLFMAKRYFQNNGFMLQRRYPRNQVTLQGNDHHSQQDRDDQFDEMFDEVDNQRSSYPQRRHSQHQFNNYQPQQRHWKQDRDDQFNERFDEVDNQRNSYNPQRRHSQYQFNDYQSQRKHWKQRKDDQSDDMFDERNKQNNGFRPQRRYPIQQRNNPQFQQRPFKQDRKADPFDEMFNKVNKQRERLLVPNPYRVTEENRVDVVDEVIAPWHKYSYDHQLTMIHNDAANCLRDLGRKLCNVHPQFRLTETGLPCYLDRAISSSVISAYRNRSEFSIWPGLDGNPKTVGFIIGSPGKHEKVVCVSTEGCTTLKESHSKFAKLFQDYLRNVSNLEVCLDFKDEKNWRNFTVRSNENGDHMLIATLHPQKLTSEELETEKELLRNYFEPLAEKHQIKSLYFQPCDGSICSHEKSPFQLIFGETAIEETLNGVKYLIPPESFFYLNKFAGEELSKTMLKLLDLSPEQTVIDLWSGIGLRSLQASPFVKKVIGFEMSLMPFEYARKNAELNGYANVKMYKMKAEEGLKMCREELWNEEVVVIAAPALDGFHSSVLPQLRSMECVKRILYVSPRPPKLNTKCCRNLFQLMLRERKDAGIEGKPFVAVNAVPHCSAPQTSSYGLIVNLERHSRFTN